MLIIGDLKYCSIICCWCNTTLIEALEHSLCFGDHRSLALRQDYCQWRVRQLALRAQALRECWRSSLLQKEPLLRSHWRLSSEKSYYISASMRPWKLQDESNSLSWGTFSISPHGNARH